MANVRRLPETPQQRLDRLDRDNCRAQVATAPIVGAPFVPASAGGDDTDDGESPGELVTLGQILDRLDAVEQRLNLLEGEHSG